MIPCNRTYCDRPAVLAIRTRLHDRDGSIDTTVYYELEAAPQVADPFCQQHGLDLLGGLVHTLTTAV